MQITYVGNREDFISAQRTHAWRKYSANTARLQQLVSPLMGAICLYFAYRLYRRHDNTFLTIVELICGLYLICARPLATLLYRRAYRRRYGGERQETTLTISDIAIDCVCKDRSSSTMQWAMVKGAIESPASILLYMSPAVFLNIPKRVLSEVQTRELMSLLEEKGIPRQAPK